MITRIIVVGVAGIIAAVLIAFLWIVLGPGATDFAPGKAVALSGYSGINPTGVPAELANANLVQRGKYLARAADCQACHTVKGGASYAGGLAFVLPIGTIYSANITPDKDTGIGNYSDAQFLNALHKGIRDDGTYLYPAMPYGSYTYMTDADALAIKAYLFSVPPVHFNPPDNRLNFPFNQRRLMGAWSVLFNPDTRFQPNPDQSPQWNRGAYLAEALGHCGECHTPRNLFEALNNRQKFAGTVQTGWRAYNITADRDSGVGAWSDAELSQYIAIGHADRRGTAAGPMGDAVDRSLGYLTPGDNAAIVAYLRTVPAIATPDLPAPKAAPAPASHKEGLAADFDPRGKAIFEGACMACHDWTGVSPLTPYATLTGVRAVNDPTGTNVAQIVLSGTERKTPDGPVFMPAFGHGYSNDEIAAVVNYVTARFGAAPSRITAKEVADLRQ